MIILISKDQNMPKKMQLKVININIIDIMMKMMMNRIINQLLNGNGMEFIT
jgi:hypothetical protein